MEAIRLVETITDKGLVINSPKLNKYVNSQVEVIILPQRKRTPTKATKKASIMDLAGALDDESAQIFREALAECRQINPASWQ